MKQFLEFLIPSIVNYPQEVTIREEIEGNAANLTIKANPEDIKVIIGRNGRTIRAIRNLLWIIAAKQGKKVNLAIQE